MAIKLIDKRADNTCSYIADTDSDVSSLPTDSNEISAGSVCTVIGSGTDYVGEFYAAANDKIYLRRLSSAVKNLWGTLIYMSAT